MAEPPSGRSHRSLCRACKPITPTKHHRNPKCDTSATATPRPGRLRRPPRRQHAGKPSLRVTPRIPPASTSAFARTARLGGGRERRRHDRRWNDLRGHLRSCGARRPTGSRQERPFEQRRDVAGLEQSLRPAVWRCTSSTLGRRTGRRPDYHARSKGPLAGRSPDVSTRHQRRLTAHPSSGVRCRN